MRALREQHGRRQDDVARAARELGLAWSRSKVAALERGDKALPAEELMLLPLVLAEAQCGQPSLADLLPQGSGTVRLGDQTTMPAAVLAQVVRGEDVDISEVTSPSIRRPSVIARAMSDTAPATDSVSAVVTHVRAVSDTAPATDSVSAVVTRAASSDTTTATELLAAERAAGDAERIAARRLGVPFTAVVAAALATWGHGLTEERDARAAQRAGPGASARSAQAARGHVTRELYRELGPAIERYHQGRSRAPERGELRHGKHQEAR
jgi:hypothetical protein